MSNEIKKDVKNSQPVTEAVTKKEEPMVTYTEKEVNQILSLINTIPVTGIDNALKISNIVMILQHQNKQN